MSRCILSYTGKEYEIKGWPWLCQSCKNWCRVSLLWWLTLHAPFKLYNSPPCNPYYIIFFFFSKTLFLLYTHTIYIRGRGLNSLNPRSIGWRMRTAPCPMDCILPSPIVLCSHKVPKHYPWTFQIMIPIPIMLSRIISCALILYWVVVVSIYAQF